MDTNVKNALKACDANDIKIWHSTQFGGWVFCKAMELDGCNVPVLAAALKEAAQPTLSDAALAAASTYNLEIGVAA